jgi:hypothetical protein
MMADAQNNLAKIRRRLQADISAFQEGTAYYIDSLELVLHDDQDDSDMATFCTSVTLLGPSVNSTFRDSTAELRG